MGRIQVSPRKKQLKLKDRRWASTKQRGGGRSKTKTEGEDILKGTKKGSQNNSKEKDLLPSISVLDPLKDKNGDPGAK